jgi:F1F0 ATPase subunit 2
MSWLSPTDVALYLTAGGALGAAYFALLLWTVRLHASQAAAIRVIPLYIMRFAAAVSAFWMIAQQGAFPLLLALLGFLIVRIAAQRWMRSA